MAIATIEKVTLIIPKAQQDFTLRLLQSFQKVELIDPAQAEQEAAPLPGGDDPQWRDSLSTIEKAQGILANLASTSAIKKLVEGRPNMTLSDLEEKTAASDWKRICSDALAFSDRLEAVRARRGELIRLMDTWAPWQALRFNPQAAMQTFKHTGLLVGSLKQEFFAAFSQSFLQATDDTGHCEALFHKGDMAGVLLLFPREIEQTLEPLCKQYEFSAYSFPFDAQPVHMLEQWQAEEAALIKEEAQLLGWLTRLAQSKAELDLAEEFFQTLLLRGDAQRMATKTNATVMLTGWMEKSITGSLEGLLESKLNFPYHLAFSAVQPQEIADVPIILKNKKMATAFENLTEMYSMPAYDEIDPTPAMTPFYLAFFGMMVADIGYGLVLLIATLAAKLFLKPDRSLKSSINFFFYLSFPVIIWGAIYGSFFGAEMPFVLLSPSTDIIPILIISLVLGWIQIVTGLSMGVYVKVKNRDVLGALSDGVSWITLMVGLALLVVSKLVLANDALFIVGAALSVAAALGIVILPMVASKGHRVKGLLKGLYALYGATGYIGDLVSYTRLMALGVAGGSIAVAFNTIIGSLPLAARLTVGILLAIALHAINLFLSLLGAYVHGIRLQYVEFFGKFYGGGGRKFSPFKTAEKHIYLIEEEGAKAPKMEEVV